MARWRKIHILPILSAIALLILSGCTVQKVPMAAPEIMFQTETYIVVQTTPGKYSVLTRSKAVINEIAKRLGCEGPHICANKWDGEVWTIQRLK